MSQTIAALAGHNRFIASEPVSRKLLRMCREIQMTSKGLRPLGPSGHRPIDVSRISRHTRQWFVDTGSLAINRLCSAKATLVLNCARQEAPVPATPPPKRKVTFAESAGASAASAAERFANAMGDPPEPAASQATLSALPHPFPPMGGGRGVSQRSPHGREVALC
jgi:hypothetical protein